MSVGKIMTVLLFAFAYYILSMPITLINISKTNIIILLQKVKML